VLGGASRQESWLAVRRAAQSLCSAWGGDGRPARTRRHAIHNEASQRRTVVGLGLLRAALRGGGGRRRLDGGSFSKWRRSRAAGGRSGGRSGSTIKASEDRNGNVTVHCGSSSRGAHAARRAWRSAGRWHGGVASTMTRQPVRSVSRLVL
jgi:hypothetical protein